MAKKRIVLTLTDEEQQVLKAWQAKQKALGRVAYMTTFFQRALSAWWKSQTEGGN